MQYNADNAIQCNTMQNNATQQTGELLKVGPMACDECVHFTVADCHPALCVRVFPDPCADPASIDQHHISRVCCSPHFIGCSMCRVSSRKRVFTQQRAALYARPFTIEYGTVLVMVGELEGERPVRFRFVFSFRLLLLSAFSSRVSSIHVTIGFGRFF